MALVIWSPRALEDIDLIARTTGADVGVSAALFIQSIFAAGAQLSLFPRSGRVVPEFGREELRQVLVGSYRVIYVVEGDEVHVATVQHGARRLTEPF